MRRLSALFAVLCIAFAARICFATSFEDQSVPAFEASVFEVSAFEDPSRAMTWETFLSGEREFLPLRNGVLHAGYTRSAYWIRIQSSNGNETAEPFILQIERNSGRTSLVRPSDPNRIELAWTEGPNQDGTTAVRTPNVGILIASESGAANDVTNGKTNGVTNRATKTVYLRMIADEGTIFTFRRQSVADWSTRISSQRFLSGIYFGILLGVIAYNAFLLLSLRDARYAHYVAFQSAFVALQAHYEGWLNVPGWTEVSLVGFASATAVFFTRSLLDTRMLAHLLDRALLALALLCLATIPFGFARPRAWMPEWVVGEVLVVGAVLLAVGCWALQRRAANAGIFVVAWSVLLAGCVLAAAVHLGAPVPLFLRHAPRVGSALEAILLSIALARYVAALRRSQENARMTLLETQANMAASLQVRVAERTSELSIALADLKRAQATLVQQARLAAMGHLVAGVVHEVGNPLNFARGASLDMNARLQQLRAALAEDKRLCPLLDKLERATQLVGAGHERIGTIVNNLRQHIRADETPPSACDVQAELETTLQLLGSAFQANAIAVHTRFSPAPRVVCRPGEMSQVFMNILVNAVQAMPEGGKLVVESRSLGDEIDFVFSDDGPGIPAKHREAVFDPFFTTKDVGEGMGLGLSISHDIVARAGGELTLLETAKGCSFRVRLPASPPGMEPPTGASLARDGAELHWPIDARKAVANSGS